MLIRGTVRAQRGSAWCGGIRTGHERPDRVRVRHHFRDEPKYGDLGFLAEKGAFELPVPGQDLLGQGESIGGMVYAGRRGQGRSNHVPGSLPRRTFLEAGRFPETAGILAFTGAVARALPGRVPDSVRRHHAALVGAADLAKSLLDLQLSAGVGGAYPRGQPGGDNGPVRPLSPPGVSRLRPGQARRSMMVTLDWPPPSHIVCRP